MAAPKKSTRQSAAAPALAFEPVWRISVATYHQMIDAGMLTDDDPVELLEGILVTKMPKTPPHSLATQLTRDALARVVLPGWCVNAQEPITLADSEPEPDVAVVRGRYRDYANHHPGAQDTALIVEVADATLRRDRGLKKRTYAAAGIPIYWIVNLAKQQIEVYADPSGTDYLQQQDYDRAAEAPVVIDGKEIGRLAVKEILP